MEEIDKLIIEKRAESNNVTVDTFSPIIKESDNIINKVENLTINDVQNCLLNKAKNLTLNNIRNDLIGWVENLTINDAGNNINRSNTIDVQIQLVGDLARKTHQMY